MGPIHCPESSVRVYHSALRNIPEESRSHVCVRPSARPPARNNSASTGRIFMKIYVWVFFENLSRITGTLHEDISIYIYNLLLQVSLYPVAVVLQWHVTQNNIHHKK
jgi:hypothetical protein